jgi:hypothetical protein
MPKRKPEVTYNTDGTVNLTLRFYNLRPKKGRNFRSVEYHDAVLKNSDLNAYVKIWRRMPRARIRKVMVEYAKNRMIQNSPVII